ncbi:MAG: tRNA (N6-isopentenyl adenosine(37)-C2)-methylthiotransferase MiaB [Clostridia bacterium]|jgi:tRNA-2-methylthio-N6-dimethylallyladenosine synthase
MDNLRKNSADCIIFDEQAEYCHRVSSMNRGLNLKYYIETLGCQMNEADSEQISGMLIQMGYSQISDILSADLIVFNTCCVRENAEFKLYGHIGELKAIKQTNKELIIVICGCMMQQPHVVEKISKSYKYIDIVFGTHNRHEFPMLLYRRLTQNRKIYDIWNENKGIAEEVPIERKSRISAFVPITYGCDNFCSYCIVPYVRGREISRDPGNIKMDILKLSKDGIKEITLLGQNVNSYYYNMDFSELLHYISDVPSIDRIRFMTSHPKDLSDNLIKAIKEIPNMCHHIHLPLQSGSSSVLKQMNRKYTKDDYLLLIDKIRNSIKDITISTDIIVGFPGETDSDFEETLSVYKKAGFDFAFTFIYSKRTGTPAANREDQIPEEIKNIRFSKLISLVNEMTLKSNINDENKVFQVLVEGKSRTDDAIMTGRTRSNKIVNFKSNADFTGKLINVKIVKGHTWHLEGEII